VSLSSHMSRRVEFGTFLHIEEQFTRVITAVRFCSAMFCLIIGLCSFFTVLVSPCFLFHCMCYRISIFGAITKTSCKNAPVSFAMSLCPSARKNLTAERTSWHFIEFY
jgi:hypothetical protein